MAGELILNEVATPTAPAASKDSIFASNLSPSRLARVDSGGNVYYVQEQAVIALTADYTVTNDGAAHPAFNSPASGQITLPANTSWVLDGQYLLNVAGSTTSHTWAILFAGTATITSLDFGLYGFGNVGSASTLTAVTGVSQTNGAGSLPTTALVFTAASILNPEIVQVKIHGILRVNAAGTFIPQIKASTTITSGTIKMQRNSFFRLIPFGSGSVASLGNWS